MIEVLLVGHTCMLGQIPHTGVFASTVGIILIVGPSEGPQLSDRAS